MNLSFFESIPLTFDQLVSIFIAFLVAVFGYRIHERMRLQQYFGELRIWSSNCLNCLSEAVHLCDLNPQLTQEPDFFNRKHELLIQISSLIDQGKLFFPSMDMSDAYEGQVTVPQNYSRKQRPLDDLVFTYSTIKKMSYTERKENELLRAPLVEINRDFCTAIQTLLDPQKSHKQFGLAMSYQSPNK